MNAKKTLLKICVHKKSNEIEKRRKIRINNRKKEKKKSEERKERVKTSFFPIAVAKKGSNNECIRKTIINFIKGNKNI